MENKVGTKLVGDFILPAEGQTGNIEKGGMVLGVFGITDIFIPADVKDVEGKEVKPETKASGNSNKQLWTRSEVVAGLEYFTLKSSLTITDLYLHSNVKGILYIGSKLFKTPAYYGDVDPGKSIISR